jgi:hypothetical protein
LRSCPSGFPPRTTVIPREVIHGRRKRESQPNWAARITMHDKSLDRGSCQRVALGGGKAGAGLNRIGIDTPSAVEIEILRA